MDQAQWWSAFVTLNYNSYLTIQITCIINMPIHVIILNNYYSWTLNQSIGLPLRRWQGLKFGSSSKGTRSMLSPTSSTWRSTSTSVTKQTPMNMCVHLGRTSCCKWHAWRYRDESTICSLTGGLRGYSTTPTRWRNTCAGPDRRHHMEGCRCYKRSMKQARF